MVKKTFRLITQRNSSLPLAKPLFHKKQRRGSACHREQSKITRRPRTITNQMKTTTPRIKLLRLMECTSAALILFLTGSYSLSAIPNGIDGVLFLKKNADYPDKLATPILFTKLEIFSQTATVHLPDPGGKTRVFFSQISDFIRFPDLARGTFTSPEQIRGLEDDYKRVLSLVEKYPQGKPTLADAIASIETAIRRLKEGEILVAGTWKPATTAVPMKAPESANTVPEITVSGRPYRSIKLTGVVGDTAKVMHSGGVASFSIANLTQEQIKLLNSTTSLVSIDENRDYKAMEPAQATAINTPTSAEGAPHGLSQPTGENWRPASLEEVAECTLLVTMDSSGAGTAFLCNEGGATYIYTNMHNMDGAIRVQFEDQKGNIYRDIEYAEVPLKPWGLWEENGDGGDMVRFKLRQYRSRALTLGRSDLPIPQGTKVGVTGNTAGEGMNVTQGSVTESNGGVIYYDTPTWKGNSGSPVVDLASFSVIGIHTWGKMDSRPSPIEIVWERDTRVGVGGGAGRAASLLIRPQWKRMEVQQFFQVAQIFDQLKRMARVLGLLDVLEPSADGLYVDVERVVQGDFKILDIFEESKNDPLVVKIFQFDAALKRNKESGVRTSNVDVLKSYRPLLAELYTQVSQRRLAIMRSEKPFYFECRFNQTYLPHLLVLYERSTGEALAWCDAKLRVGGKIPLSERPRFPKLGISNWRQALMINESAQ